MRAIVLISLVIIANLPFKAPPKHVRSDKSPNIIFILADDLGYGDLGCYGQKQIRTPNLDRMAREGIRFTNFYAGSTVCAPSRCVLMTGLHTGHCYIRGNARYSLRPEDVTVPNVLKRAGYSTALIGKWGLGEAGSTGVPTKQGFDYFYGYLNQVHAHNNFPSFLWRNEEKVPLPNVVPKEGAEGQGEATVKRVYSPDLMTEQAIGYIGDHKAAPFFLYLAYTVPHANNEAGNKGMEVPDLGEYKNRDWPENEKAYAAIVTRMDRDIGRILDWLKYLGIDENTVVMFSSDNGPHKEGGHDPAFFKSSGPFRGIKRDLYEGGIRMPMIVRWPGKVKAATVSKHVGYFADILPTCSGLAGIKPPNLDGISFLPELTGQGRQNRHDFLYWEFYEQGSSRAVRMGNWKAVCRPFEGRVELYDLASDPAELEDVASKHDDIVGRACAAMYNAHTPSTLWPIPRKDEVDPYRPPPPSTKSRRRPNVVLILTDDQGYGDLGVHGNEKIRTPNLDRLASESARLTRFYVCPVCAPTRASLMTGRYNYRTGVVDTYLGRALMFPDEVTLPERLRSAGYRTGIFGKWHLGDNYPLRAIDQGFQEALVCLGGGIGQPSDPEGNSYQDPILQHNGKPEKHHGYCTDIFTDEAIHFIERNRDNPFYVHLSPNAPHVPLEVADQFVAPYRTMGLDEVTAKVYAMVTNIDDNVGRLLTKLRDLGLERDTIVVFMTDNGPQQVRFNAGMRGLKGSVYEGGIRVPCLIRWAGELMPRSVDRVAAHIDIGPTILDACGVKSSYGTEVDGRSLLPLLRGSSTSWPDRTIYTQWHRGDAPEKFRNCAAISQQYKLVDGKELYDLAGDPTESRDIAAVNPDIAGSLRSGYEAWFNDVSSTRGYEPPRIVLGDRAENPVTLSRQDWRGRWANWNQDGLGYWEVRVARSGQFRITLALWLQPFSTTIHTKIGGVNAIRNVPAGSRTCTFDNIRLTSGPGRFEAWSDTGAGPVGVRYVIVERTK